MNRPIVALAAVLGAAAASLAVAPVAHAGKPTPPPMSVACAFGTTPTSMTGTGTIGWAYNPPSGTRGVSFTFYRDQVAVSEPWSGPNGGTDTNGRDGWSSWGDPNPPAGWSTNPTYMIVQALDRKGNVLREIGTACPTP